MRWLQPPRSPPAPATSTCNKVPYSEFHPLWWPHAPPAPSSEVGDNPRVATILESSLGLTLKKKILRFHLPLSPLNSVVKGKNETSPWGQGQKLPWWHLPCTEAPLHPTTTSPNLGGSCLSGFIWLHGYVLLCYMEMLHITRSNKTW